MAHNNKTFREWCMVSGEKNDFDKRRAFHSWSEYAKLGEDAEAATTAMASGETATEVTPMGTAMNNASDGNVAMYATPLQPNGKDIITR